MFAVEYIKLAQGTFALREQFFKYILLKLNVVHQFILSRINVIFLII